MNTAGLEQGKVHSVQSVERALDIIEALSESPKGISLSELSDLVNLHASTTHRLLRTLNLRGYVAKDPYSGKYILSTRMFEIGNAAISGTDLLEVSRLHLEQLADLLQETVHLVVRDGDEIVYLIKNEVTSGNVNIASRVGTRNPMYCTGVGKAILATLDDETIEGIWNRTQVTQFTPTTITTLDRLKEELESIRKLGYATDYEEHAQGICCVAAVILNSNKNAIAAISVTAPSARMNSRTMQLYAPHITQAAEKIAKQMTAP